MLEIRNASLTNFLLSISERSPEVLCKRILNKVPQEIRKINYVNSFKKSLQILIC